MVKNVLTELCSSSPFRGCLCSVGAGRNGVSRSRKGKTCQVRASRQTPLRSFSIPPTRCESEEVHKFKEHRGDCIIPHTNHTFNSYFHINVVLGVMLCRFHPLTDKVGVLVHKVYDALVIFGVLVVLAVALHHFEGSQVHLYGFNNLIANPCR